MKRCACGRSALFRVKGGRVKTDADHDLCQRCWRDTFNAVKARSKSVRSR